MSEPTYLGDASLDALRNMVRMGEVASPFDDPYAFEKIAWAKRAKAEIDRRGAAKPTRNLCGQCAHWHDLGAELGQCRYNKAVPFQRGNVTHLIYPEVRADRFCSKWSAR